MKKVATLVVFAVLFSSLGVLTHVRASSNGVPPLATSPLHGDDTPTCSNDTLEGAYGLSISGTRPVPNVPGATEQVIGVGIRTFDGAGSFAQITNEKGSVTGLPLPNRALQGTYTVNSDCSGTLDLDVPGLPFPIVYDIVVVQHGRAFDSIVATPTTVMVTTSGRRVD